MLLFECRRSDGCFEAHELEQEAAVGPNEAFGETEAESVLEPHRLVLDEIGDEERGGARHAHQAVDEYAASWLCVCIGVGVDGLADEGGRLGQIGLDASAADVHERAAHEANIDIVVEGLRGRHLRLLLALGCVEHVRYAERGQLALVQRNLTFCWHDMIKEDNTKELSTSQCNIRVSEEAIRQYLVVVVEWRVGLVIVNGALVRLLAKQVEQATQSRLLGVVHP